MRSLIITIVAITGIITIIMKLRWLFIRTCPFGMRSAHAGVFGVGLLVRDCAGIREAHSEGVNRLESSLQDRFRSESICGCRCR